MRCWPEWPLFTPGTGRKPGNNQTLRWHSGRGTHSRYTPPRTSPRYSETLIVRKSCFELPSHRTLSAQKHIACSHSCRWRGTDLRRPREKRPNVCRYLPPTRSVIFCLLTTCFFRVG